MTPRFSTSALPRRAVMGVVNVTPDSFSDGGRFFDPGAAIAHAYALVDAGAAVLDIGGESTRPGAVPVDAAEETARVLPVVEALANAGVPISVDTTKASVAVAALTAGATVVNDVSGATADPDMLRVVAEAGAGLLVMHMQGTPTTMQRDPHYDDVVAEVGAHLRWRVGAAVAAGVSRDAILADPGIGFGKTIAHNLALLAALPDLATRTGVPLAVGASRKSFIGRLLGDVPADQREEGTLAISMWCFERGAALVRVHDVESSARAARLLDVCERASQHGIAA